jgi:hypothetical protein
VFTTTCEVDAVERQPVAILILYIVISTLSNSLFQVMQMVLLHLSCEATTSFIKGGCLMCLDIMFGVVLILLHSEGV